MNNKKIETTFKKQEIIKHKIINLIRGDKVINIKSVVQEKGLLKKYLKSIDALDSDMATDLEFIYYLFTSNIPENPIIVNNNQGTQAIGWYTIGSTRKGKKSLTLEELGTHPNNLLWNPDKSKRIRGAGTIVIRELIKDAKELKIDIIYVNNPGREILKFYKKVGFTIEKGEAYLILDKNYIKEKQLL